VDSVAVVRMVMEAGRRRRVDGVQVRNSDVAVRLQIGFLTAKAEKRFIFSSFIIKGGN
jgi:hypothetical protein